MIEIIILIFLTKNIGALAASKGLPSRKWKIWLILGWIAGELLGAMIGVMIFGPDNLFSVMLIAISGALGAYFIIKNHLTGLPDDVENDIENIGRGK